jgi:hypothetical protein
VLYRISLCAVNTVLYPIVHVSVVIIVADCTVLYCVLVSSSVGTVLYCVLVSSSVGTVLYCVLVSSSVVYECMWRIMCE